MTPAMVQRARAGAAAAGLANVEIRLGDALALPIDDASIDALISMVSSTSRATSSGRTRRVDRPAYASSAAEKMK
jgi:hypothetical protein